MAGSRITFFLHSTTSRSFRGENSPESEPDFLLVRLRDRWNVFSPRKGCMGRSTSGGSVTLLRGEDATTGFRTYSEGQEGTFNVDM